jgi:hypothetical protein
MILNHKAPCEGAACIQQLRGGCALCLGFLFLALSAGPSRIAGTPAIVRRIALAQINPSSGGGGLQYRFWTRTEAGHNEVHNVNH